jgi:hypothetical protein
VVGLKLEPKAALMREEGGAQPEEFVVRLSTLLVNICVENDNVVLSVIKLRIAQVARVDSVTTRRKVHSPPKAVL